MPRPCLYCRLPIARGSRCRGCSVLRRGGAWRSARRRCLERDGHSCRACGLPCPHPAHHPIDHVVPLRGGGSHRASNLRTLCVPCHRRRGA